MSDYRVFFKDEDIDEKGNTIGPVTVWNTKAMIPNEKDPDIVLGPDNQVLGRRYGAPPPAGVTELGWHTRTQAMAIAREHETELEES